MPDLQRQLMEDRTDLRRVGTVTAAAGNFPSVRGARQRHYGVEPVTRYLRDLALRGMSARTCRSYGYGLSRWFRTLWMLKVDLGTCDRIGGRCPGQMDQDGT